MNYIKNFFCKTDPSNLAFGTVMFLILVAEGIWIGPVFIVIVAVGIVVIAAAIGIGFVLHRIIKHLQTKCKED